MLPTPQRKRINAIVLSEVIGGVSIQTFTYLRPNANTSLSDYDAPLMKIKEVGIILRMHFVKNIVHFSNGTTTAHSKNMPSAPL